MNIMEFSRKNVRIAVGKVNSGETVIFTQGGELQSVLMPHQEYLKLLSAKSLHIQTTACQIPEIKK